MFDHCHRAHLVAAILVITLVAGLASLARGQAQPAPAPPAIPVAPAAPSTAPSTAAAAIPTDQSTPKSALRVLADSMEAGDANRIRGVLHAANATEQKMTEGMIALATALADLKTSAVAQFGKQAAIPLTDDPEAMAAAGLERLAAATEAVEPSGDRATVTLAEPGEPPAVVVKVDGKWRFPVAELAKGTSDAEVQDGIELLGGQAKLIREVATEVKQGKYKSADEVRQTLDQRVMQFVMSRQQGGAATDAATKPAGDGATPRAPAPAPAPAR